MTSATSRGHFLTAAAVWTQLKTGNSIPIRSDRQTLVGLRVPHTLGGGVGTNNHFEEP